MTRTSSRPLLSSLAFPLVAMLVATLGAPGTADAQRRGKKNRKSAAQAACKMSFLPFVTGRTWTYQYAIPPGVEDRPGAIKAKVPEKLTIKVKSVESTSGGAKITLDESYRKVQRETVLTCDSKGLIVPPESFYFAGELPGAMGMTMTEVKIDGDMYPSGSGLSRGQSMYVEIKADVSRASAPGTNAKHPLAKLEIERQITIGSNEDVETEHGIHTATAVEVALSGRTALVPEIEKKVSLPEGNAMLWFTKGVGLVRAYNRLDQGWELATFTDGDGANIE